MFWNWKEFFAQTKAKISTGARGSYNQTTDRIQVPPFNAFRRPVDYYSALVHDACHFTKHPKPLNRDFGRGREIYAKEELVAELGVCFLGAMLGFELMPEEEHAAYGFKSGQGC